MNKQRLIVSAGTLGMLWLPACANPCADDGLFQENEGICPTLPGEDGGESDSDSDSDATPGSGGAGDCTNGVQDGDETDVDCGGSCVDQCGSGEGCQMPNDCQSGICGDDMTCGDPESCSDGIPNGDETDVDCGGSCEAKCQDGEGCVMPEDCESGLCAEGMVCASPSCEDGFQNGDETDVDCGGPLCDGCEDGEDCVQGSDCQSEVCGPDDVCVAPTCSDGAQNGDETDVDCGGSCDPCPTGDDCIEGGDCQSGVCDPDTNTCAPPACDDGVQNGGETDLDCGGECGSTCIPGQMCELFIDCVHLVCDGETNTCAEPTCEDGTPNGNETDVDCGGPDCPACDVPGQCVEDSDCISNVCDDGQCVPGTCADGEQNGDETDVDCGGPLCAPCPDGDGCMMDSDCQSEVCDPGTMECVPGTCTDGLQNGDETDIDCGGPVCDGCDNGQMCDQDGDCMSMMCDPALDVCEGAECTDGLQNGSETDVDCGGPDCAPCDDGEMCLENGDCASEFCDGDICTVPSCEDGVQNGLESDIDCGGGLCPPCDDGEMCVTEFDCASMVCLNEECQAASCSDTVLNGNETDVDCGGPDCQPCDNGEMCQIGSDCESGVCDADLMICVGPSCADGLQNGDETDTDCGGPLCDPCPDGDMCLEDSDCESMVCNSELNLCDPPSCVDGVQNGDETDTDCGGACGATCEPGQGCLEGGVDGDCASGGCDPGTLTCNEYLSVSASPACSDFAGMPVTLAATASGGTGGPYTYAWTPDDGSLTTPDMAMTDASPTGFQSYTVTVDDGFGSAQDSVVVVDANPFNLEDNCTLLTADYNAGANEATITYDLDGTRACELGNNEFGLHLCDQVVFEQVRLQGTLEVLDADGDNDWFGLVWGAQDQSNFYSLAWKQGPQDFFGCTTPGGVLVKRIEGPDFASLGGADFFCPNDTDNSTVLLTPEQALANGWEEGESYTVTIDYLPTESNISIMRDSDDLVLAQFTVMDDTFPSGFFGSTTLSQVNACVGPLLGSCL